MGLRFRGRNVRSGSRFVVQSAVQIVELYQLLGSGFLEGNSMIIEGNQKEKDAMKAFHEGDRQKGLELQEEFAAAFREEYKEKDHCPCKKACRYHGNCKECVAIHRAHQEHVPNCMRPIINSKLKSLSELTEHTIANEIEAPHEILIK